MDAQDLSHRQAEDTPRLSNTEKEKLLRIARETLTEYLTSGTTPQYAPEEPGLLQEVAAFVTLRRHNGELRGCIGRVEVSKPLFQTVQECAISSATNDFRFPSVTAEELAADIFIEISALSPFQLVHDPEEIQVGLHGLLIRKDFRVGLLLPQVASDRGWTRDEFLHAVCLKASLPSDAWREADLHSFTAEVFEEK